MHRKPFGATGREVAATGQGTWRIRSRRDAEEALRVGLELGLTHVDTAELYENQTRSETLLGGVLRDVDREEVFLASKVLPSNASYEGTLRACEGSLRRLGTAYLDLYYLHWWSDRHPLEDTMRAMERLVDEGKVRHVGVSNFDVEELEAAERALRTHPLAANQVYYSLLERGPERAVLPWCRERDVALVAYSPFGAEGGFPEAGTPERRALDEVAERHGASAHQVALAFLARQDGVFPIPKAEKAGHVRDNAQAADVELDRDDLAVLDRAFPRPSKDEPLNVV